MMVTEEEANEKRKAKEKPRMSHRQAMEVLDMSYVCKLGYSDFKYGNWCTMKRISLSENNGLGIFIVTVSSFAHWS